MLPNICLIQKSSCTSVHCGFLIFASLETPLFKSPPVKIRNNSYTPHDATSPNIKKQFPYQRYSICSTAMDGVAARGIVNGRVAATIIFVIFACGRFI